MLEKRVAAILTKKRLKIAVAESCTGGLIAAALTNVSGSSKYFQLGIVAYANEAKHKLLKVSQDTIRRHGAVSQEVALGLAQNVRRLAGVDIGIGVTGIAGPKGAMPSKPVGTIFIAVAIKKHTYFNKFKFSGNRLKVRQLAKNAALKLLLKCLQ